MIGGRVCPVLNVTVPLTALLGLDDAPAEIAGIGAVPAQVGRDLAAVAPIWRRLLTDPVDGSLVVQDIKTYRPSPAQRRLVLARHDWASAGRGGEGTRSGLQLDHDTPWADGGPTSVLNLPPLDPRTHDRKTEQLWTHAYDGATATLTQTTPLGRTYRTTPLPPVGPTGTRAGPDPDPPDPPGPDRDDQHDDSRDEALWAARLAAGPPDDWDGTG